MINHEKILELLNHRHACKEFNPQQKISESDMKMILTAGQLSPSSLGMEPWKFLVIENSDLIKELVPVTPGGMKQLETCSHLVIVLSRKPQDLKHDSKYLDHLVHDVKQFPEEAAEKYKNTVALIERNRFNHNDKAILGYSTSQAYLAIANMALVGAMVGVDSCPIGAFNGKAVCDILLEHNLLDADHFTLTLMLAFGYRAKDITPKKRQSFEEVISWVK